jgi:plastocyanin
VFSSGRGCGPGARLASFAASRQARAKESTMKRLTPLVIGAILAAVLAAGALGSASAPRTVSITIRHQVAHCHTWSAGGAWRASLAVKVARGGTIHFTNNDMMPHKLVKVSGPAVKFAGKPNMNHMGATVSVRFAKAGVYTFTTKPGEDYMAGMKTTGEDNVLRLKVKVS